MGVKDLYRLALVDDEPWVLLGLKDIIPWQEYAFTVAYMFESAEDAIQTLRRDRVDVVFTDIRLPEMDGIDLAGVIRAEDLADSVVILSAYRDFEFARRAIDEKVAHYLLKPLDRDEVIRTTDHLRETLDELRARANAGAKPFPIDLNDESAMGGASTLRFLDECAIGPSCFLALGAHAPLHTPEKRIAPIVLNGNMEAALICVNGQDRADTALSAASRRHHDFSQLERMLREARAAEEFRFTYTAHPLCSEIQFYIATHYMQRVTIGSLARQFYLSKVYLSERFKRQTGLTLITFLTDIRIKHAMKLLKTTSLSIREVAKRCGYDDASYFGRIFKKRTDISPEEYRMAEQAAIRSGPPSGRARQCPEVS